MLRGDTYSRTCRASPRTDAVIARPAYTLKIGFFRGMTHTNVRFRPECHASLAGTTGGLQGAHYGSHALDDIPSQARRYFPLRPCQERHDLGSSHLCDADLRNCRTRHRTCQDLSLARHEPG